MAEQKGAGFFDALLTSWMKVGREMEDGGVGVNEMVATVCRLARSIPPEALADWVEGQARKHTTMPFLDPTRYREEMPDIEAWTKLGSLVLTLGRETEKVFREAELRAALK